MPNTQNVVNGQTSQTWTNPTATGYTFTGWKITESNGGSEITANAGTITSYAPTQNVTLTAQWTAAQYNITYYDVDASSATVTFSGTHGSGYPTNHTYGTATTLVDPTKPNYKFLGWFVANSGSGSPVTELTATGYTGNITLYAKWEQAYTLTLNINGGSWANASDDKTQYSASDLPLTLPAPTAPSGFTFAGWADNTNLSGAQNSVTITSGTTGDKTYYAVYKTSSTSNNAATTSSATGSIEFVAVQGGTVPLAANYMPVVSNFSMGKYEITRKQWENVMQDFPSWMITPTGNADNNPVDSISWYAAIAFCNKLSIMENKNPCYSVRVSGQEVNWANLAFADIPTAVNTDWDAATCDMNQNGYRLPTEAEWEYAARGGINHSPYEYSGSDTVDDVAWYGSNSSNVTNEVGQKAPNALTIYDMSGNLSEWCWDWYNYPYETSVTNNPTGVSTGSNRINRGGDRSCINTDVLKVSDRGTNDPTIGHGLRIVCRP